jgi:uncharacterized protein YdeI (YjbR/CyaY-like superfamily)
MRMKNKSGIYSYENLPTKFSAEYKKKFMLNKKAWEFFNSLPPFYQMVSTRWVMSAKQEITRVRRLETLINDSAVKQKIKPMSYDSKK